MNNIGVYGLGVMGQSLARNIMQHGFSVSVYNPEKAVSKGSCRCAKGISSAESA